MARGVERGSSCLRRCLSSFSVVVMSPLTLVMFVVVDAFAFDLNLDLTPRFDMHCLRTTPLDLHPHLPLMLPWLPTPPIQ